MRGVGMVTIRVPLGSVASYLIDADVQVLISMTHNDEQAWVRILRRHGAHLQKPSHREQQRSKQCGWWWQAEKAFGTRYL